MTPRRGEVWAVTGPAPRTVLVVSGNMFNDLPDHPFVLAVEVVADVDVPAAVNLGDGQLAVVDTIGRVPKRLFGKWLRQVDTQTMSDVDGWLFKIFSTS